MCPGMSHNNKIHQLKSYRDVIMGKPFQEICHSNALKIIYHPWAIFTTDKMEWKNGKMDVPLSSELRYHSLTQISYDSEILQTFVEAVNITHVDIDTYDNLIPNNIADFHLNIGGYDCQSFQVDRSECLMPVANYPVTIFTKEFQIKRAETFWLIREAVKVR